MAGVVSCVVNGLTFLFEAPPECLCPALILDNISLGITQFFLWVWSLVLTNANGLLRNSS